MVVCDNQIMFLPRFTIRAVLWVTTLAAAVCVVFGLAVRNNVWAIGIASAVATIVLILCVHALTYLAMRWTAEVCGLNPVPASSLATQQAAAGLAADSQRDDAAAPDQNAAGNDD